MANRLFFSRLRPAPSALVLCLAASASLGSATALGGCDGDDTTDAPAVGADAATGTDAAASSDATTTTDAGADVTTTDSSTTDAGQDAATDASTDDASSDAATDAAVTDSGAAVDGGPYGLVYSGKFNGIDLRNVSASLTVDGKMLGYVFSPNEAPYVITAKVDDLFADTFVSAGKWTDGTVGGRFYDDGGVKTLSANEAFHYGLARVPTPPPASGTANYTLLAATKPQVENGSKAAGTVTAASLSVSFNGTTSTNIGYSITLTTPDGTFDVTGGGGPGSPGDAGAGFDLADAGYRFYTPSLQALGDGGVCTSACSGNGYIVFAGAGAERAVIAYTFGGANPQRGVVVLQKQ